MIDVTHNCDDGRACNSVLGDADLDGIEHHSFFKCHEFGVGIEILRNGFRHLLIQRLINGRKHTPVHQFFLHVLSQNTELFRKILYRNAFRQRDASMFPWNFRFRLWPDKWRFKLLLGLTFIPLRAIDAFVHGWASLFHRWSHRRRRSRTDPRTLPGGHSRSRAAVLETWRGRMPLTWSLAGTHRSWRIRSALLAGRRSWRQSMFLPQTFLHNLLHCLPLLLRRFVLRRGYYRRNRGPDPRWGWNDSSALWRELRLRRLDWMRRCRLLHLWSRRRRCRRW